MGENDEGNIDDLINDETNNNFSNKKIDLAYTKVTDLKYNRSNHAPKAANHKHHTSAPRQIFQSVLTRALSRNVHYSVCQTSPIKSDRFKDWLFFYTGKTGYQKPPTSWDIIWKSRGGIMVNGVSREVSRQKPERPKAARVLAVGPPEALHSPWYPLGFSK